MTNIFPKLDREDALRRYKTDPIFHAVVETMARMIAEREIAAEDLQAAVNLATERAEEFSYA